MFAPRVLLASLLAFLSACAIRQIVQEPPSFCIGCPCWCMCSAPVLQLAIHGTSLTSTVPNVADGLWHFVCTSWQPSQSTARVSVDARASCGSSDSGPVQADQNAATLKYGLACVVQSVLAALISNKYKRELPRACNHGRALLVMRMLLPNLPCCQVSDHCGHTHRPRWMLADWTATSDGRRELQPSRPCVQLRGVHEGGDDVDDPAVGSQGRRASPPHADRSSVVLVMFVPLLHSELAIAVSRAAYCGHHG